jgi:glycosyltransferase 2 family protein
LKMKSKIVFSLLLGTLFSIITLYFAFKNVPFAELIQYLASVNYLWIIPSILAIVLAFILRVIRWQIILGASRPISFWEAFHPLMIGFMANCVYPGRVGEIARPLILRAKSQVPFTTGLATVIAERVLDLLFLVFLFGLILLKIEPQNGHQIQFAGYRIDHTVMVDLGKGMLFMGAVLVAIIILICFEKSRNKIETLIIKLPALMFFLNTTQKIIIENKFTTFTSKIMGNIVSGFALVKSPKRIYICLVYSAFIWTLSAYSYYIMAKGCPGIDLSIFEITAVMVVICFAIALPSAPGYWGLWEAGGVFALNLFGVSQKDALGFTLINHAIQMFPVIIIGLVSAWITGVSLRRISKKKIIEN